MILRSQGSHQDIGLSREHIEAGTVLSYSLSTAQVVADIVVNPAAYHSCLTCRWTWVRYDVVHSISVSIRLLF